LTDASGAGGQDSGQAQADDVTAADPAAETTSTKPQEKSEAAADTGKGGAKRMTLEEAASKAFDELQAKADDKPKRDAQGRFVSGEAEADEGNEADETKGDKPEDKAAKKTETKTETKDAKAASTDAKPPQHWSAQDKEAFDALPAGAKPLAMKFVKSLESGFTQKFQDVARDRQRIEPMRPLLDAIKRDAEADGIGEAEAVGRLYRAHLGLVQDPEKALPAICRAYGIDLGKFATKAAGTAPAAETSQPGTDGYVDPQIAELRTTLAQKDKDITELRQIVNRVTGHIDQQTQTARERHDAALNQAIHDFRDATDEQGQPKHPHFAEVSKVMGSLMEDGHARSLDEAYEMAVNAHPAIRAKVDADRRAREEAEAKAKREEKERRERAAVEAARKAGRLSPQPQTQSTTQRPKSIGDAASMAYDQLMAGR